MRNHTNITHILDALVCIVARNNLKIKSGLTSRLVKKSSLVCHGDSRVGVARYE